MVETPEGMTLTVLVSVNNTVSVRAAVVALVIIGPISCM